ncbi:unnamed protein product, partial [Coregonus sp. 'balchen']
SPSHPGGGSDASGVYPHQADLSPCLSLSDPVEEPRAPATQEEVAMLEEFIPTRLTCLTLLKVTVTLNMAEFNLLHTLMPVIMGQKAPPGPVSVPVFQAVRPLPALRLQVDSVNVEHSVPMYAPELTSTVSSLSQPSDNLLHHCYTHCYLKVRGSTHTHTHCYL